MPFYTPQLFTRLFPIDFLALALLALDPLPLGEVEPKRGRGQAQSTSVQSVNPLIRFRPPPRLGSTPPARGQGYEYDSRGQE